MVWDGPRGKICVADHNACQRPGWLSPGEYEIWLGEQGSGTSAGKLTLKPGQSLTLRCELAAGRCTPDQGQESPKGLSSGSPEL